MPLAMARPWKHPNSGIYWLRRRVPGDLRSLVGKREIKLSLRTTDPREARRLHAAALAELDASWKVLREGTPPDARPSKRVDLTEKDAHTLAGRLYGQIISLYESNPSTFQWSIGVGEKLWTSPAHPPVSQGASWDEVPKTSVDRFGAMIRDPEWHKQMGMQEYCLQLADECLQANSLNVDQESRLRLARAMGYVMQSAARTLQRYAKGNYGPDPDAPHYRSSAQLPQPSQPNGGSVSLDMLIEGWAGERQPATKTLYSWRRTLDQLATFVGHRDASRLTVENIIAWKAQLIADGLSPKTIRDGKLAPLRTILRWGTDNRHLPENVSERVDIDVRVRPSERKRSYTDQEARLLLRAAQTETDPVRRWIPMLCAYSGARVSEICQMRAEDVLQIEGYWCMRMAAEAGSLKNFGSERVVPLHPALLKSDFLRFVQSVGSGPLFKNLTPDRFGSRGGNGTKVLSRWIRGLGLTDPRLSPNHSWRHRLKTLARRHGLDTSIIDAVTGHSRRTVSDTYGEFPVEALARELYKIPTLNLVQPEQGTKDS